MHGLINKSIQCFLRDSYGTALWEAVARETGLDTVGFEAMLHYDDAVTERMIGAAAALKNRPRAALLEDLGAYLASVEGLRRLLRFGGGDYWDFLRSLDELPGRSRMALVDLELPELDLREVGGGHFSLVVSGKVPGWGAVMAGLLRAMADDYGALAVIEWEDSGREERIDVTLLEARYTDGRSFELARPQREEAPA
jgi:hypothetical protein